MVGAIFASVSSAGSLVALIEFNIDSLNVLTISDLNGGCVQIG